MLSHCLDLHRTGKNGGDKSLVRFCPLPHRCIPSSSVSVLTSGFFHLHLFWALLPSDNPFLSSSTFPLTPLLALSQVVLSPRGLPWLPLASRRKSSSLIPSYLALLSLPRWMFFLTECPSLLTQQERGRAFRDPRVHSAFGVPVGEGSWHLME